MTTKAILYKRPDDGGVSILIPQEPYLSMFGVHLIATKDVPDGVAYKIVDLADVPPRGERDGWMQDDAEFSDGFGKGQYIEKPTTKE